VQRDANLPQVGKALGPPGGLAGRLHGREEEANERGHDRDHHQELDEREPAEGHAGTGQILRRPGKPDVFHKKCSKKRKAIETHSQHVGLF
jgi:hypothetical protein